MLATLPLTAVVTAVLAVSAVLSQSPADRPPTDRAPDAPWPQVDTRTVSRVDRVLFAVAPRLGARCRDGRLRLDRAPGAQRAFDAALGLRRVDALLPPLAPAPAGRVEAPPLPDLRRWFRVGTRGADDTARVVGELRALPGVQFAYAEPAPTACDLGAALPQRDRRDDPTPVLHGEQTHLAAAPIGIGHRAVEHLPGGRGAGRRIAVVEARWSLPHEDLPALARAEIVTLGATPRRAAGPDSDDPRSDHAVATAGILLAARDDRGVDGIVPEVDAAVLVDLGMGSAVAIAEAALRLGPGDVVCCSYGYTVLAPDGLAHAPLDWDPATRDVIAVATAAGIVVCLAAGNSGRDLGDATVFGGLYRGSDREAGPGAQPAGALLIGALVPAATPTGSARHPRSNHGAAVDAAALGSGVVTAGYGDRFDPGDPTRRYTARYGATSAATALVAGAVTALVGAVEARHGVVLQPWAIRRALRDGRHTVLGDVGSAVDLAELFGRFGLPDGLDLEHGPDTASLVVRGEPGAPFALSITAAPAGLTIPHVGRLEVDLGAELDRIVGRLDGHGTARVPLPIARAAAPLLAQAVLCRDGAIHTTNAVVVAPRAAR